MSRGSRLFLQPFRPEVDWSGRANGARSARPDGPACSCGERGVHTIAIRTTIDGVTVRIYSDGQVAVDPDHRGAALPYTERELQAARRLAWFAGWHTAREIPAVHRALLEVHEHLVTPTEADERTAVRAALARSA